MGMDFVELAIELEDRYGVDAHGFDFAPVVTVADVAAFVVARMPTPTDPSPTAHAFYRLRREIIEVWGIEKRRIRPSTRLDDIMPADRRRAWRKLKRLERRLPTLVASRRGEDRLLWIDLVIWTAGVIGIAWVWPVIGPELGAVLAFLSLIGLSIVCGKFNNLFRTRWRDELKTIGHLACAVTNSGARPTPTRAGQRLIEAVRIAEEIRAIIAEIGHLPIEKVKLESRLVQDLGFA